MAGKMGTWSEYFKQITSKTFSQINAHLLLLFCFNNQVDFFTPSLLLINEYKILLFCGCNDVIVFGREPALIIFLVFVSLFIFFTYISSINLQKNMSGSVCKAYLLYNNLEINF